MPSKKSKLEHQFIWERLHTEAEQPALSRTQIVQAAIAIADAKGVQGITMRQIAAELGAGAMSLYRHIFSKDDLMIDDVFGEIRLPEPDSRAWRNNLASLVRETRAVFKRHPWMNAVLSTRPRLGPNYMR